MKRDTVYTYAPGNMVYKSSTNEGSQRRADRKDHIYETHKIRSTLQRDQVTNDAINHYINASKPHPLYGTSSYEHSCRSSPTTDTTSKGEERNREKGWPSAT
jgi:hypothetical protein